MYKFVIDTFILLISAARVNQRVTSMQLGCLFRFGSYIAYYKKNKNLSGSQCNFTIKASERLKCGTLIILLKTRCCLAMCLSGMLESNT